MDGHDLRFLIKRFSLIFFPLVILIMVLHFSYLSKADNSRFQHIADKEIVSLDYFSDLIAKDFADIRLQLLSLSELPSLVNYVNQPNDMTQQGIAKYFQKVANLRKKYDQIRYIDKAGFEKIRVNYKNGQAMIVTAPFLQDKSSRYYIAKTLKLKEGEIFISPLDLNTENGKLERPLKPVIRFATPVRNKQGKVEGMIILNYLADNLYNTFFAHYSDKGFGRPFVLDSNKNILFSQDYSLGSALYDIGSLKQSEQSKSLSRSIAELEELGNVSSQIKRAKSFYLLDSLFKEKVELHDSSNRNFILSLKDRLGWQVGLIANQNDLYEEATRFSENGMGLVSFYSMLIAFIAFALAKLGLQQKHLQVERLRVESERKEEFEALIESVPSGFLVANENGQISKVNKGIEELFGYSRDELIGEYIDKLVPKLSNDVAANDGGKKTDEPYKTTNVIPPDSWIDGLNKRGDKVPVSISMTEIHTFSGLVTVASVFDMTEQKRHQEALSLAMEEANKANQAKSLFLSTMSHEIRTPLNAIIGMLYLHKSSGLNSEQLSQVNVIKIASDKLLMLINDILDFSKIEAGEMVLEKEPFHLISVLDEMQSIFSLQAQASGNTLEIDSLVSKDIPILLGDRTRLGQILINLLSNACKFTKKGHIKLRVSEVQPKNKTQVFLRFEVLDTGIGINAESLSKIFDSFSQSNLSITRKYGGTGLGLSIVKKLTSLFNGKISVSSELDLGTKFTVEIPFEYTNNVFDETLNQTLPLRVLIADDDTNDRDVLLKKSQQLGWSAEALASGEALIEKAMESLQNGQAVDCIIVDWYMPTMDGIQTIEALNERIGDENMPSIIMVTAAQKESLTQSIEHFQPDSVLTKPVQASTLFNSVNEALVKHGSDPDVILNKTQLSATDDKWLSGMCILVVDDSEMNLLVCKDILLRQGAEVEISESGAAAIELLKSGHTKFDAILMDIQMPEMNGLEATKIIRQELKLLLPIIALSAGVTYEERKMVNEAGMNAFLSKPMEPELMIKTLTRLIGFYRTVSMDVPVKPAQNKITQKINWPIIEGVDDEHAQRIASNNLEFYQSMLALFIEEQATVCESVEQLIQEQDFKMIRAKIHKLNGQAGNLGLTNLHRVGMRLEKAAQNESLQEVEQLYPEFKAIQSKLIKHLKAVVGL